MSEQEEKQAQAMTLLEFTEKKKRFAALTGEASKLATELERLANALKHHPEQVSFDGESMEMSFHAGRQDFKAGLLDFARVQNLARDIRKTIGEKNTLQDRVKQLGLDV